MYCVRNASSTESCEDMNLLLVGTRQSRATPLVCYSETLLSLAAAGEQRIQAHASPSLSQRRGGRGTGLIIITHCGTFTRVGSSKLIPCWFHSQAQLQKTVNEHGALGSVCPFITPACVLWSGSSSEPNWLLEFISEYRIYTGNLCSYGVTNDVGYVERMLAKTLASGVRVMVVFCISTTS